MHASAGRLKLSKDDEPVQGVIGRRRMAFVVRAGAFAKDSHVSTDVPMRGTSLVQSVFVEHDASAMPNTPRRHATVERRPIMLLRRQAAMSHLQRRRQTHGPG
jgi:hypothetical protein